MFESLAANDAPIVAGPDESSYISTLREHVVKVLNEQGLPMLAAEALDHPDRASLDSFDIADDDVEHAGLYLRSTETGFMPLVAYRAEGTVAIADQQVEFTVLRLDETFVRDGNDRHDRQARRVGAHEQR